jgi:hypothetical protein
MTPAAIPLIIVDAANVVGSRPDGWWRDRQAATQRLRDRLSDLAATGLPHAEPPWARQPPLEVVMVTEGRARNTRSSDTVTIVAAPANGDDTIVDLAADAAHRHCLVITSDRQLQHRVHAHGAHTAGATTLH